MPLVRIDLVAGRSPEERQAIGAAIHQAMTETIGVPDDDLFQIITEHARGDLRADPHYLAIDRDDGVVVVHMTMKSGRTTEQKRALYRRIAELLEERCGIRPGNVLVVLAENGLADWSFGEGEAQLLGDQS
jgi:phenylpyruvate tautomerase PptA (4-oxalocrotonate tautomerase family)